MTFDALGAAPLLGTTPLLVVHERVDANYALELAAAAHTRAARRAPGWPFEYRAQC